VKLNHRKTEGKRYTRTVLRYQSRKGTAAARRDADSKTA